MKLGLIGSNVERDKTRLDGIEVAAVARLLAERYRTLIPVGGTGGLTAAFAEAFEAAGGAVVAPAAPSIDAGLDALLCYPGGLETMGRLFEFLATGSSDPELPGKPIFLYNWEKFYSPLLLQIETAAVSGLIAPDPIRSLMAFESVEELSRLLSPSD